MTPNELLGTRKGDWERLTRYLQRARRGHLADFSESELVEIGNLYRAATSDLAIAQRDFPRHNLAVYLNNLVGRAHPLVYHGDPLVWRRIAEFYRRGMPRLYRELGGYTLCAAILLFGAALLFYLVVLANPPAADYVLPGSLISNIKSGHLWFKDGDIAGEAMAAVLMSNNIRVSFLAFSGGMLAGLFTVYVLVLNGLILGGVFSLMQVYGHAAPLWEFVVGHGVLELSEITMAGGSGLLLGHAMLQPGLLSRRNALMVAAQKAMRLLLGSVPLLIIAGLIEGLLSPSDAPAAFKYAAGIGSGVVLYAYLLLAGRSGEAARRGEQYKGGYL